MLETGLRLAGALSWYWYLHDAMREGRPRLEDLLARTPGADRSVARGRALLGAGMLAWAEDDFESASLHAAEALSIAREAGEKHMAARAGAVLGLVRMSQGNTAEARSLFEESHLLSQDLGDNWGEAMALYYLGTTTYRSGDLAAARAHYEESLRLFRQQGDVLYGSVVSCALAVIAVTEGDPEQARSLDQQLEPLMQQARNRGELGILLTNLGDIWLHRYGDER